MHPLWGMISIYVNNVAVSYLMSHPNFIYLTIGFNSEMIMIATIYVVFPSSSPFIYSSTHPVE